MDTDQAQNERLILFFGAGASAALGMPTASGFITILKNRVTDSEVLFPRCVSYLVQHGEIRDEENLTPELFHDWLVHNRDISSGETRGYFEKLMTEFDKAVADTFFDIDPEAAFRHYRPFLYLPGIASLSTIPVFTTNYDTSLESACRYGDSRWGMASEGNYRKKVIRLYRFFDIPDFCEIFEDCLRPGEGKLLIVIGFSFNDRRITSMVAEGIEAGLRLLVLDSSLQYKQLAERLNISNIKHKARIEKTEFGNRDESTIKLLSGIVRDEMQRTGIFIGI
ncbi:MAG: hypothetical protein JW712_12225 [Dehalococcoidales bacterium]|nr:hypothetical protein [Dehalococcoidales bacterium]